MLRSKGVQYPIHTRGRCSLSYRQVLYIFPEAKFLMHVYHRVRAQNLQRARLALRLCGIRLCPIAGSSVEMKTASVRTIAGKAALHLLV